MGTSSWGAELMGEHTAALPKEVSCKCQQGQQAGCGQRPPLRAWAPAAEASPPPAPCSAPVQACCSWVEPPITCQEAAAAGMMLQSILRVTLEHLSAWSATPSMCHHEVPGTPTGPQTLTESHSPQGPSASPPPWLPNNINPTPLSPGTTGRALISPHPTRLAPGVPSSGDSAKCI